MILLSTGELSCQGRSASERGRGGCTSPQRAAEPGPGVSAVTAAKPGPRGHRLPPPLRVTWPAGFPSITRATAAELASWSCSHSPPRTSAAPQQPPGRDGGRTESAGRPETLLPVSAPPPGRPSPTLRPGPAARGIVGDVVGACGEAARALSPGAPGDAVAWQPRGAAAATLEEMPHPDGELKSQRPTTDLPSENQPSRCC